MKIIKSIPIPMAGLILSLFALGNLIVSYGTVYKTSFGIIGTILLFAYIIKIIVMPKAFLKELNHPVISSVVPTFSMSLMLFSTYLSPNFPKISLSVWILGIIIHIVLMAFYTKNFIINFNIKKIFPSIFVVYVGIVVASITSPAFKMQLLGQFIFYFGITAYLLLLPIVLYRVFRVQEIPEPALPTIAIIAAPSSLCLAGYMTVFPNKNLIIVFTLLTLSLVMTLGVLLYMPKMLKLSFYPSYAAFTFPLVISGIAIKKTHMFLLNSQNLSSLQSVVKLEEILAVIMVLYVLIHFIRYIVSKLAEKHNHILFFNGNSI